MTDVIDMLMLHFIVPGFRKRLNQFNAKIAAMPSDSSLARRLREWVATSLAAYNALAADHLDRMAASTNTNLVTGHSHCSLIYERHSLALQLSSTEQLEWRPLGAALFAEFTVAETIGVNGILMVALDSGNEMPPLEAVSKAAILAN
jgi:hypothetical protein